MLDLLTDPDAASRWAPVPFDVDDLDGERLLAGSRARVSGKLAGRRVGFELEVHEADESGIQLSASGPVAFDVDYRLSRAGCGGEVHASVSVRSGGGLTGRLLAEATGALLTAGALQAALGRSPGKPRSATPDPTPHQGTHMLDIAPTLVKAPAVAATAVTRRYGDGESAVDALRGVTLEVPAGQFTAVMGPRAPASPR